MSAQQVAERGGDSSGRASKEARLEALLVLQVYEVAAAMEEEGEEVGTGPNMARVRSPPAEMYGLGHD